MMHSIARWAAASFAALTCVAAAPAAAQTLVPFFAGRCVEEIVAGAHHTCALLGTGDVGCWGDDSFGQLQAPGGDFEQIAAGGDFSCGIRPGGQVECWGDTSCWNFPTPGADFVQIDAS